LDLDLLAHLKVQLVNLYRSYINPEIYGLK